MTTFAGQWGPEEFIDRRGNAVLDAVVTVYELDGVTPAALFTDRDRTAAAANPLTVGVAEGAPGLDTQGNGTFWADPGRYVLVAVYQGDEVLRSPVTVNVDPAEQTDVDAAAIAAHIGSTTNVHGIPDTALLVNAAQLAQEAADRVVGDSALAAALAALDAAIDQANLAYVNVDNVFTQPQTLPGDPLLALQAAPKQYVDAGDVAVVALVSALSASAVLDGDAAGGVLSGTYPNPGFAVDMATQSELNDEIVLRIAGDATNAAALAALDAAIDQANIAYVNVANVFTQNQRINAKLGIGVAPTLSVGIQVGNGGIALGGVGDAYYSPGQLAYALYAGGSPNTQLVAAAAAHVPLVLRGFAGQTADLLQMQDSAGASKVAVKANGDVWVQGGNLFLDKIGGYTSGQVVFNAGTNVGIGVTPTAALDVGGDVNIRSSSRLAVDTIRGYGSSTVTVQSFAAGDVLLKIKLAASQTADALQVQDSTAAVLAKFTSNGYLNAGYVQLRRSMGSQSTGFQFEGAGDLITNVGYNNSTGRTGIRVPDAANAFTIETLVATATPLVVRGFTSQTADLLQLLDSTSAVLSRFDAAGKLGIGIAPISGAHLSLYDSGSPILQFVNSTTGSLTSDGVKLSMPNLNFYVENQEAGSIFFRTAAIDRLQIGATGTVTVNGFTAASVGLVVKGAAGQSGRLVEVRNSADTAMLSLDADGTLRSNYTAFGSMSLPWMNTPLAVSPGATTQVGVVIRGLASQTADLQQWQASDTSIKAKVRSDGYIFGTAFFTVAIGGSYNSASGNSYALYEGASPNTILVAAASAHVPLVLKGAASQTGDLQQWQDSTGAVNLKVDSGGNIVFPSTTIGKSITIDGQVGQTNPAIFFKAGGVFYNEIGTNNSAGGIIVGAAVGDFAVRTQSKRVLFSNDGGSSAQLLIDGSAASTVILTVKGRASQTADIQQWQDSTAGVLAFVDAVGNAAFGGLGIAKVTGVNAPWGFFGGNDGIAALAQLTVRSRLAGRVGLEVKGFTSQTADLQQWMDIGANVLLRVAADGRFGTPDDKTYFNYGGNENSYITAKSASKIPLKLVGVAAQTADLLQLIDSTSAVLSRFDATGRLGIGVVPANPLQVQGNAYIAGNVTITGSVLPNNVQATAYVQGAGSYFAYNGDPSALFKNEGPTTAIVVAIRAKASQTGDLFQAQDSTGAVLSRFDAAGFAAVGSGSRYTALAIPLISAARDTDADTFVTISNTNAGAAARAGLVVKAENARLLLSAFSSGYTSQGNDAQLYVDGNRHLMIDTRGTGSLTLRTGNADRIKIDADGKMAFYGGATVAQGAAITDAANSTPVAPTAADFDALVAKFNALLARVRPTTGVALIAA